MTVETYESVRGQAYTGHMRDASKLRAKGKKKAEEPSQLNESNEQMTCLLQHLHNVGVLEDVGTNILQDSIVQIAFTQVLNKLDIVTT